MSLRSVYSIVNLSTAFSRYVQAVSAIEARVECVRICVSRCSSIEV